MTTGSAVNVVLLVDASRSSSTAGPKLERYWREGLAGSALDKARTVLALGNAYSLDSDAFLGNDGSVAVAFYRHERSVEVVIEPSGEMALFVEEGVGFAFEDVEEPLESASIGAVAVRLEELTGGDAWSLSGSSSRATGIVGSSDSRILHSSDLPGQRKAPQTEGVESRFLSWSVPATLSLLDVFVST